MSNPLPDFKRRALERRRMQRIEEYEAVIQQQSHTLNAADALKLQRQADALEREIAQLNAELGRQETEPPPEPEPAKAQKGDKAQDPVQPFGTGNRWAVLVGVNHYVNPAYPRLQVCVKDVTALYQQLIDVGYDPDRIRLLSDDTTPLPTRPKILSAVKQLAKAAERDDLVVFYYSGHGDIANGTSYLVARDGEPHALEYTAVALSEITNILKTSAARAKVIILDACHSGADFAGKGPKSMPPDFIERVFKQAQGQAILASCQQGEFSYEWKEQERSVFTHFLLEALSGKADLDDKSLVTVQDVNRYVSNGVRKWAFQNEKSQTPTLQSVMSGDIILVDLA